MLDFTETDGLFEKFEVNREPFWPQIARLLVGSVALHLVLTACVIFIPPVRDALSMAAMFSGAGFGRSSAYNKTQIENEGDITEITLEKFHYPEGYFAMDAQAMPSPEFPQPAPFTPTSFLPSQLAGSVANSGAFAGRQPITGHRGECNANAQRQSKRRGREGKAKDRRRAG